MENPYYSYSLPAVARTALDVASTPLFLHIDLRAAR